MTLLVVQRCSFASTRLQVQDSGLRTSKSFIATSNSEGDSSAVGP